jgi:hypothetical protein
MVWRACGNTRDVKKYLPTLQQFARDPRDGQPPSHIVSLDSTCRKRKMRPLSRLNNPPTVGQPSARSIMTGTAEILTGPWCGAARWWFGALDCRSFVVGGREWTAHVAGIHVARFDVWIQLDMAGVVPRSLVLHITRGMNVPDAVAAIESMIAVDGDSLH